MDKAELLELIAHHGEHIPGIEAPWRLLAPEQILLRECLNPSCGDWIDVELRVAAGAVELRGKAEGCQLSRAAASLLAEAIEVAPLQLAAARLDTLVRVRQGTLGPEAAAAMADEDRFAELAAMAVLQVAPLRRRCISMVWDVARELLGQASTSPSSPTHRW